MPEFLDLHGLTNKAVRAAAEAAVQAHGLHLGQDRLLAVLWNEDGRTPGEIAAEVGVSTPAVVKMSARLIDAGLITRRRDDRDLRLVRLWLTDAGQALRQPIESARVRLEQEITQDLTEAERRTLLSALAKVQRAATALLARADEHPVPS